MPITVKCEQCGTLVAAPDSAAGKKGRCTVCGTITVIPLFEVEQPSDDPPAPSAPSKSADELSASIRVVDPAQLAEPAPVTAPALAAQPGLVLSPTTEKPAETAPPPAKKGMSCAMLGLIVLGVLFALAAAAGLLLYFLVWPMIKDRYGSAAAETQAQATIHVLETAEESYRNKFDFYASRISGDPSLESAGFLESTAIAQAEAPPGAGKPFGAYCFRILSAQGAHAPGGAASYRDSTGQMKFKYAILAYPAVYGAAKKTYLRGPDGAIYFKDLGSSTPKVAVALRTFDPDETWTRAAGPLDNNGH